MYNVTIIDQFNNNVLIEVVRYFKTNLETYLIYSLNEVDESGFVKLYAAKLIDNNNFAKIESEIEWNQVKDFIKIIVKEAKDGLVSGEDLDYTKLKNANVMSNRIFKLTAQVKDMLGLNKKEFKEEIVMAPVVEAKEEVFTPTPLVENELVFETPVTLEEPVKKEEEVQLEERIVKKISTLEELLGEGPKEGENPFTLPSHNEEPVFETKPLEKVEEDLEATVADLKAQIAIYEAKLNELREILK